MDRADSDADLIRAVIDRIMPPDDDPGALDLGADEFVLAQLRGDCLELAAVIRDGLVALDRSARDRFGMGLVELDAAGRDAMISTIEDAAWFRALAELTMEGFYADPANGGNRDALSWTMIGYEHRLPEGPSGRLAGASRLEGQEV